MLTIFPDCWPIITFPASRQQSQAPVTLVSSTDRHSSTVVSSGGLLIRIAAALLMSTSTRDVQRTASATRFTTSDSLAMSAGATSRRSGSTAI